MPRRKIDLETKGAELVEQSRSQRPDQESFAQAVDAVGTGSMLGYRLEQQAALSNFGMEALKSTIVSDLLDQAAKTAALGMRANLSKILEYRKVENDLLVRAGIGWRSGVIGKTSFGADLESPAGYAFHTGSPVISNHLEAEDQFRTPLLMVEHGVKRAINVLITYEGGRWGVLEVDSSSGGEFEAADLAFLQGLANFIGVALNRQVAEDRLSQALDYQKVLVQEASHRVNNSLAILSGILMMKAKSSKTAREADALGDASDRVIAVARTHERLWREASNEMIDLGMLLSDLCRTLGDQLDHIEIDCHVEDTEASPRRRGNICAVGDRTGHQFSQTRIWAGRRHCSRRTGHGGRAACADGHRRRQGPGCGFQHRSRRQGQPGHEPDSGAGAKPGRHRCLRSGRRHALHGQILTQLGCHQCAQIRFRPCAEMRNHLRRRNAADARAIRQ